MYPFIKSNSNTRSFGIATKNKEWREGLKKYLPVVEVVFWQRALKAVGMLECFANSTGTYGMITVWGWSISFQLRHKCSGQYKSYINIKLPKMFWK